MYTRSDGCVCDDVFQNLVHYGIIEWTMLTHCKANPSAQVECGSLKFSLLFSQTSCWKKSRCRWFETIWCSCDVLIMQHYMLITIVSVDVLIAGGVSDGDDDNDRQCCWVISLCIWHDCVLGIGMYTLCLKCSAHWWASQLWQEAFIIHTL